MSRILLPGMRIQSIKTRLIYRIFQIKMTGVVKCAPEHHLNETIYFLGSQLEDEFVVLKENE